MSRRLNRVWLLLAFFVSGEVLALGLGDIKLDSALNQPLRADIELISATPDELANLTIAIASADTFSRYGIDRPLFLTNVTFTIIPSGRTDGNIIRVSSPEPVTEPFLTFLVEAVWSSGRLLREYTLLLDPPTFAPRPTAEAPQAVVAPTRATPADSGRVTREVPPPPPVQTQTQRPRPETPAQTSTPAPVREPVQATDPAPTVEATPEVSPSFDDTPTGNLTVQRGDTLWGIARRTRQDNRLTINQTMLAIYEANPQAFAGNINVLTAGETLRIPSSDEIFRINRGEALSEVLRQHEAWAGSAGVAISRPAPSLTLVPPDEDTTTTDSGALYDGGDLQADPVTEEAASDARIRDIEQLLADHQESLIEIGDNELTALRIELAELRGEEYIPEPVAEDIELPIEDAVIDDTVTDDEVFVDDSIDATTDDTTTDDTLADDTVADEDTDTVAPEVTPEPAVVATRTQDEPGIMGSIWGALTGAWGLIAIALVAVAIVLVWFARRAARGGDDDSTGVWQELDADEQVSEPFDSTESLRALARDDESSMLVEETMASAPPEATKFRPVTVAPVAPVAGDGDGDFLADTATNQTLEDTFSSDTAINLDQSDAVAEADFHMAYGLYDQAADLINGALEVEPERRDLLTKLCEIYFVWGNKDSFVDAASRLSSTLSGQEDSEWDKIVIMGQQIAADHKMFADVKPGAGARAVDMSFEEGAGESGVLDIDFASESDGLASDDVIDLGADMSMVETGVTEDAGHVDSSSLDFVFDEPDIGASVTQEMPQEDFDAVFDEPTVALSAVDNTIESPTLETAELEPTAEAPAIESTVESPTIEQQLASSDATGDMARLDTKGNVLALGPSDETEIANLDDIDSRDATAEIDLDDLGLDLESLANSEESDVFDSDAGLLSDLDDTAESQTLKFDEDLAATGRNPALALDELSETGENPELVDSQETSATGLHSAFEFDETLAATSEMPRIEDVTGQNIALSEDNLGDTDIGLDTKLLDATGQTQVLPSDYAVDTGTGTDIREALTDDEAPMLASSLPDTEAELSSEAETMLAPLDEDDGDFDFAKTEALPRDAFIGDATPEETGLSAGSTDMDLDLDDLTAALKVSAAGDTVNQTRDDATVEQPRPNVLKGSEFGDEDDSPTAAIAPEDLSGDLHDARTMTEVGTKLDLARAYVDMGDPSGARSILEEVLDEGDEGQRQQAQQLLESLPS